MRKSPETAQKSLYDFDKPAKERILDASELLFRRYGIRSSLSAIAHLAHSNMETLAKYFGSGDALVQRYVTSIISEAENFWQGFADKHPDNPTMQLRLWLDYEMDDEPGYILRPEVVLSQMAAELVLDPKNASLAKIAAYWHAERRKVFKLCQAAGLREPSEACDKLLLLVHGARSQRDAFGRLKPRRLLCQAGEDILAAHGCTIKAPDNLYGDEEEPF